MGCNIAIDCADDRPAKQSMVWTPSNRPIITQTEQMYHKMMRTMENHKMKVKSMYFSVKS